MIDNQNEAEQVRELFARFADDPAPPLGFTADGIADAGRRGARTRRIGTVGGATAGIAAIALAVVTLPGAVAARRGSSAGTPVTVPPAQSVPACATEVTEYFQKHPTPAPAQQELALQMCPTLRAIKTVLDPTGRHVTESGSSASSPPDLVLLSLVGNPSSVRTTWCYTDGSHVPNPPESACDSLPALFIEIIFSLPGDPDPTPMWGDMTLADRKPGLPPGRVAWATKEVAYEGGSAITIGEVRNGDRVALKARRVLASGAALTIVASDAYDTTSKIEQPGSVYDPFPFTIAQMKAAAEVEQLVTTDALKPFPVVSPTHQQLGVTSIEPLPPGTRN